MGKIVTILIVLFFPLYFVNAVTCMDSTGAKTTGTSCNDCVAQGKVCAENNDGKANPPGTVTLTNPLGEAATKAGVNGLIGQVINGILGVVGSLALLMFIYGGFTWMLAAGANEKVQKGKDTLMWATLGLVVIFSAYAVLNFVLKGLTGLT